MVMEACSPCQRLLGLNPDPGFRLPIHKSLSSFQASVKAKCPICLIVWRRILHSTIPIGSVPEKINIYGASVYDHEYELCIRYPDLTISTPDSILIRAFKTTDLDSSHISTDPMSETSISQINRWLENCTHCHVACSSRLDATAKIGGQLPTRLIDLNGQQAKSWNIVMTESPFERYKYVALSHRWTSNIPKLNQANLRQFQDCQFDSMLPKDYQHVMMLCRALSIRYLWIDSLCILQDSKQDFHREAATMVHVYTRAFLTMSICWPSESGCLPIRDSSSMVPEILLPSANGKQQEVIMLYDHFEWRDCVLNAPVNQRGWVVQERMLSQRILYISKEQFYWECDNLRASEVYPKLRYHYDNSFGKRLNLTDKASLSGKIKWKWLDIIKEYTRRDLSFQNDKWIALSGIARQVASVSGDNYIAGLWKSQLLLDLLWYPVPGYVKLQSDCYAPSWSWASAFRPITYESLTVWSMLYAETTPDGFAAFNEDNLKPLAWVDNACMLSSGTDQFGNISSASIDLRCLMISADTEELAHGDVQFGFRLVHQTSSDPPPLSERKHGVRGLIGSFETDKYPVKLDGPYQASLTSVILPLVYSEWGWGMGLLIHGLVIQPVQVGDQSQPKECGMKEFKRMGMFTMKFHSEDDDTQLDSEDDDTQLLLALILNTFLQLAPEHQQNSELRDVNKEASGQRSEREEQQFLFESRLRAFAQKAKVRGRRIYKKSWIETDDRLDATWSTIRLV